MAVLPSTVRERFPPEGGNDPYKMRIIQTGDSPAESIIVEGWLPEEVTLDVSAQYEAPYAQGLNGYMPVVGQLARFLGVSLVTQAMTAQIWQGSTELNFQIPVIFQAETDAYQEVIKPIKDLLKLTMPKDPSNGGLLEAPGPRINIDRLKTPIGIPNQPKTPTPQATVRGTVTDGIEAANSFSSGLSTRIVDIASEAKLSDLTNISWSSLSRTAVNGIANLKDYANSGSVAFNRALINAIDGNIQLYIGAFLFFNSVVITDVSQMYNVLIAPDNNPSRATVNVTFRTFYIPTQRDLDVMFRAGVGNPGVSQEQAAENLTSQILSGGIPDFGALNFA